MMRKLRFAPLLLAALILGCQNIPTPTTGSTQSQSVTSQRVEYGYLRIAIRWPRQTQTMPSNTQSIKLKLTDSQGNAVKLNGQDELIIPKQGSDYRALLAIPKGTGYKLDGWAYSESAPTNSSVPIGTGSKSGIDIKANEMASVSLEIFPVGYPVIDSIDKSNGGYGSTIVITGRSFNGDAVVWFNLQDGSTTSVTPLLNPAISSTSISVNVPTNAKNGTLLVKSGGQLSNPSSLFTVIKTITVSPTSATIQRDGTQTFTAAVKDTNNADVANPNFTWSSDNTAIGTINAQGIFSPLSVGSTTVRATSGSVSGAASITVNPVPPYQPGSLNLPAGNAGDINGTVAMPGGLNGDTSATFNLPGSQNGSINVTFPMPAGNAGAANP